jgi:hypothetical protein
MKQTIAQRNAETKKQNALFMKLPKARKRVAIARDVLAQLGTKIVAIKGTYLLAPALRANASDQLQGHLQKLIQCRACALGAMFVCGVQRANDLTVREARLVGGGIGGWDTTNSSANVYLRRFFSREQLTLIETAYEGQKIGFVTVPHKDIKLAEEFYSEVNDLNSGGEGSDAFRLRMIMENIIANKGTFKPEILPESKVVTPGYKG